MSAAPGDPPAERPDRDDAARAYRAAESVVRDLVEAGHVAYFAGGCVRDRLMQRAPKDYDVATDAPPDRIRAVFPQAQAVGEAFGVMLVRRKGCCIEVATFRTEGDYADGRHPRTVAYSDAEHDASRRDFTINGLFEDPVDGRIIDYVGGRDDLHARVVRAIGEPADRLREDRLRMLRAVRFAARFAFSIEPATADEIRRGAHDLRGVSRERVGQEVRWMLTDANRAVAAWELAYLSLDATVLDEPTCLAAPQRLGRLPDDAPYATALAAWWLDRSEGGGAATAADTAAMIDRWSRSLMLSGAERRDLERGLAIHRILRGPWWTSGVAAQKRLASDPLFGQGLLLLRTENLQAFVDVRRRVAELAATGLAPTPLITGADLIGAGLVPGPAFQPILDGVYDAQLEGQLTTREEALAMARRIARTLG